MLGSFGNRYLEAVPAIYMSLAVVCYSAIPILFKLGRAEESPFLFTGLHQICIGIGIGTAMLLFKKDLLLDKDVGVEIWSHSMKWPMFVSVLGSCGFALFAFSLFYVDVSIAAMLYETWPLFWIFLVSFLFREKGQDTQRYEPIYTSTMMFVLLALAGVALVILSHNQEAEPLHTIRSNFADARTWYGVFLVLTSAVCVALPAYTLKMGKSLAESHSRAEAKETSEFVFSIVMTCICMVMAGCAIFTIGLLGTESISFHQVLFSTMSGLFVHSVATVALRAANLKTKNLGVNALAYATPVVALVWIWLFSTLDVPHIDYLVIGAMGIIAANMLINVDASERMAYKALVVSLWVFGTFTYFFEGYETNVPLELPVTIFILVMAFRVDRLVRRTGQEEEWVVEGFRRLTTLATKNSSRRNLAKAFLDASNAMLDIDYHNSAGELKQAYSDMVRHLDEAAREKGDVDEIRDIRQIVDNLSHSRQQGSRFGEIVAIALTGALIVFGLLVFNGEHKVFGEIISFVLPSVVVFLFFNILDLQGDRSDKTLIKSERDGHVGYVVNFGEVKDREMQQYISMTISGAIVVVFVVLFFVKA